MTGPQVKNTSLPEGLLAEVQKAAEAEKRSPEALVEEAVTAYLERKRLQELYAYGARQAEKMGIPEAEIPDVVKQWRRETAERGR